MSFFIFMIWLGGALGNGDLKIGFFNRVFWPFKLGAALMRDIYNRPDYDKLED